jgi:acetyl/propionyl-CoA carboxylase alpha subunit/acetyl-CoA carboxylase carboxyltransferase component
MAGLERVLIANRGEIAVRIARAAAALGMTSVSVYAAADALSLHTRATTRSRAIGIGTSEPVAAYLDIAGLVAAARAEGCDCVHPGYGFLAESAAFAEAVTAAGLTFVGPPSSALALFGDKLRARALAQSLDIPVVPGSDAALGSAAAAADVAAGIGYPVMLKAAAGGGGRGMRVVQSGEEIEDAFARCASEAQAAFGDGTLFMEKLVAHPRHIEVQVLGDAHGQFVHLFDRDCSVQVRHQKLVELAPAVGLAPEVRGRLFDEAVRLVAASGFYGAGTVEFLVVPETGEHWFIECNPRIQVEHTVTEQVMGLDLVCAQFRLAAGASLAELGLPDQAAAGTPRGFAVQARVVTQGPGRLNAYKEPAGPGVRVDAAAYLGWAPPPQFDPLLAKVIGASGAGTSLAAAVDRTRRALDEFHIGGVATNLAQLRAILAHERVREGDARTSFMHIDYAGEQPVARDGALALLSRQATLAGAGAGLALTAAPLAGSATGLAVGEGEVGVAAPMAGTLVAVAVQPGDTVRDGDTLVVISAMKMESQVVAPATGTVVAVAEVAVGDSVAAGQVMVTLAPAALTERSAEAGFGENSWAPQLAAVDQLRALGAARLAPGSDDPGVVRQRARGKLTCRERIELLLDPDSFHEIGSIAGFASYDEGGAVAAFTPANMVGGRGTIASRGVIVCADDFTSRGGHADGAIAAKSTYLDRLSIELGVPSLRLLDGSSGGGSVARMVPEQKHAGESTAEESAGAISAGKPRVSGGGGSFLPAHLHSTMYAEQLATVPVINLLLGSVVGIGAAKAVLGHFSVMVADTAQLFVAGPPVVAHAMGYDISKEDLGGWHIHCRNGAVDNVAASEEEAMTLARRFLSYLPSSVHEAPPVVVSDDPRDRREEELFTLVPRKRTSTFDVRRAIELMADRGSFFEIGPLWGTDQVTGFARFGGYPVGVIASDSQHANGGALTAAGCEKLTRHIDLCDLFHLPIVSLVDNPGFAVGLEHEIAATIRRGAHWMIAFAQAEVPIFTVIMRRSFGVAGNNYATPRAAAAMRVAWPAADVGGIPPEGGIEAAYKRQLAEAEDPAALRAELEARIESARGPVGPLNRFELEEMIDPRDTRRHVCEWIEQARRVATAPARLTPRAIRFRP